MHRTSTATFSVSWFSFVSWFSLCLVAAPRFSPRVSFRTRDDFYGVFNAPAALSGGDVREHGKDLPDGTMGSDGDARADDDAHADGTTLEAGEPRTDI